ncbi:MAG: sensor histidine kinase [Rubrivivax sp.]|jgi:signal transduction histidine kinase
MQALAQARGLSSQELVFSALNNSARLWVVQADRSAERGEDPQRWLAQARGPALEAAQIAQAAGQPGWQINAWANLGGIDRRLRQVEPARQHFESALAMALRLGETAQVATLKLALACLAFEAAPGPETCAGVEACLDAPATGTDHELLRQARHTLVQGCRRMNDLGRALHHMDQLHRSTMAEHVRQADLQARLLFARAELAQARHQAERAQLDAELQRLRAEAAVRAKARFLGVAGHELRTPLNGVLGMLEVSRRLSTDPALSRRLDMAVDAGRGLAALVSQLLEVVAAEEGGSVPDTASDWCALMQSALDKFQADARGRVLGARLDIGRDLPQRLKIDAAKTHRVLELLLDNALKFATQGPVVVSVHWQDGWLALDVADGGPGIAAEVQQRLFQVFELGDASSTRTRGGLGLGLALVRSLVLSMGGTVGLDTAPGRGSVFRARWPASAVDASSDRLDAVAQGQPAPNSSSAQAG